MSLSKKLVTWSLLLWSVFSLGMMTGGTDTTLGSKIWLIGTVCILALYGLWILLEGD